MCCGPGRVGPIWGVPENRFVGEIARTYDQPGTGMFSSGVLETTVDCLVELVDGGAALEFAIGTGRVAVPLAARAVPVTGIELSADMLAVLRPKRSRALGGAGLAVAARSAVGLMGERARRDGGSDRGPADGTGRGS